MKKYNIFDIYGNDINRYYAYSEKQAVTIVNDLNNRNYDNKRSYVFVLCK